MNIEKKTGTVIAIAVAIVITIFGIMTVIASLAPSGSAQMPTTSNNMTQQQNTTATTTAIYDPTSTNKTFYIFNQEIQGLDENKTGLPADTFSLPVIVANKGDNLTVHMYKTENETDDRHSFTPGGPYQSGNATFTANQEGVFIYYCKYHLPTMTGELVVLPANSTLPRAQ